MKKSIIPVLLLLPSLLAGCTTPQKKDDTDDEEKQYVPQDISARDVSYPTEILMCARVYLHVCLLQHYL